MRKSVRAIIILWIVLGILIVGIIAGGIYLSQNNRSFLSLFNTSNQKEELLVDKKVSMEGITDLSLDLTSDEVSIYPSTSGELEVKHYGVNIDENQYLQVKESGSKITVSRAFNWTFFSFSLFEQSRVEIYLPEAYQENLDVSLSSGQITFDSDYTFAKLKLDLTSGKIISQNLTADDAKVYLTSGDIVIGNLSTSTYFIDVTSGSIDMGGLKGSGTVETTSGTVNLNKVDITDSMKVDVTSGFISIGLMGNPSLDFTGDVTSGNIDTYFDTYQKKDEDHYTAQIGNAPYKTLDIEVTSGTVEVTKD